MNIDIVYFDVTSGHRSAAQAIMAAIKMKSPSANVRMVNLVDILTHNRLLLGIANSGIDLFNWGVRQEMALLPKEQIRFFQWVQRTLPAKATRVVSSFWASRPVDVVISVIPICNLFLEKALHAVRPECPYVVLPVDFEEGLPRYWFDPEMDAHYLVPTTKLMEQGRAAGIPNEKLQRVAGMPIDPSFYEPLEADRESLLEKAGLTPEHKTVLVSFGGQGSALVEQCARQLSTLGSALNVIFLCGRNEASKARVSALSTPYAKLVLGFSKEAPARQYMLADVIVGKPGSMTLTEALVVRRPLVTVSSKPLVVVQRGNEDWIREAGVGVVTDSRRVAQAVGEVLQDESFRRRAEEQWHRGIFEITDAIMHQATTQTENVA